MAINPSTLPGYNGQTAAPDANYTYGSARDDASPGDLTGTPRVAAEINDYFGFLQALLNAASIVPSGSPDTVLVSQYLDATKIVSKESVTRDFDTVAQVVASTDASLISEGENVRINERDALFSTVTLASLGGGVLDGFGEINLVGFPLLALSIKEEDLSSGKKHGVTTTGNNQPAINASNAVSGNTVTVPKGINPVSTTITLERFSSLVGSANDVHARSVSNLSWDGGAGNLIKTTSDFGLKSLRLDGNGVANTTAVIVGNDSAFENDINLKDLWLTDWDVGVELKNCLDIRLENTRIEGGRLGVHITPVNFGPDGGYITTVKLSQMYVTNNSEEGLLDEAQVKNKMLCIGDNSVFELNGDATHPQIKLKEGQVNSLNELYIEDGTDTAVGIEMRNGYLQNAYINGFGDAGVDFTAFTSSGLLDNIKFADGVGPSVKSTAAGNARYICMRLCEFSTEPSLNGKIVEYQGCTNMPDGLPDNAHIITGTTPLWGVGTTPAVTRDIEAWPKTIGGQSIPANSQIRDTLVIGSGRMTEDFTSLVVTAQTQLAVGLTLHCERSNNNNVIIVVSNITTSSVSLVTTNFLVRMERFFSINS